jgi:hypothetical protein
MAFWNRNDNGMGNRGRGMLGRAEGAIRNMGNRGGYDRGMMGGDRSTGRWNGDSYASGGMGGRFNNQYDRDLTYRGNPGANVDGGIGRPLGYGYGAGDRDEAGYARNSYDRNFSGRMDTGYDRGYGATTGSNMYDRGYHNRHQVDTGDPFGDRQQHTPVRVMRERDIDNLGNRGMTGRGGYDRDWMIGGSGMERTDINRGDRLNRLSSDRLDRQDESYRAYQDYDGYSRGLNYEPYYNAADQDGMGGREVGDMGFRNGYDQNYQNRRDRDWF